MKILLARLARLYQLPYTLLAAALLLLSPLLQRSFAGSPLIPAPESYAALAGKGVYSLLLNALASLGDMVVLVSVLIGLASAALAHILAARFTKNKETRMLLVILFLISPFFVATFTRLAPETLGIPLLLLCLLFKRRLARGLTALVLALVNPALALPALIALLFLKQDKRSWLPGIVAAIPLALLVTRPSYTTPLLELGTVGGLSFIIVTLALIEAALRWRDASQRRAIVLFVLALLVAPWHPSLFILAGLASIPLAAQLITRLDRRTWIVADARPLTLLLIGCSLLFLLLVHEGMVAAQEPSLNTVRTLVLARGGVMLAPPELAPIISHFSGAQPLLDKRSCTLKPSLCLDVTTLYDARRLADAQPIIQRYGITSLLITKEMREGGVWRYDEDGLLFLLAHSDSFLKVSDAPELWLTNESRG